MEKYSKFRDEATGIAPFQVLKAPSQDFNWLETLAVTVFAVVNIPVAISSILLYAAIFSWLPLGIDRLFLRAVVLRTLRLLYISFAYDGERRVSVRKTQISRAQPGDIIISNFVSPLDALVYAAHHEVVFCVPGTGGSFVRQSLSAVVKRALSIGETTQHGVDMEHIVTRAKKAGAIVVLFAEGTTSNGRGLLTLKDVNFRGCAAIEGRVFCAVIKYTPSSATSPVPRTLLGYIWALFTSTWWYMVTVKASGEPLAKSLVTKEGVSRVITGLGRTRQIGDRLDSKTKREYVNAVRTNKASR